MGLEWMEMGHMLINIIYLYNTINAIFGGVRIYTKIDAWKIHQHINYITSPTFTDHQDKQANLSPERYLFCH